MPTGQTYAVHGEPVWRDRANYILNVQLSEPGRLEQLWARRTGASDRYEICCIPFFAYDLALGDVVTAGSDGLVDSVVEASGRFVFRVFFDPDAITNKPAVIDELSRIGCLVESSSKSLIAIDARDHEHAKMVANFLVSAESRFGSLFETGKS